MPLKFVANISTMFGEAAKLTDRYALAKDFGFSAVEFQFPYDFSIESLCRARENANVKQVLLNSYPGPQGKFGMALQPTSAFSESLDITLNYAKALKCEKIHVIAGLNESGLNNSEKSTAYLQNLNYAAKVLEQNDILGVIEPLCPEVKPNYFLNSFDAAVGFIKSINSPYLKLLLDVYHLQMLSGNLTHRINNYFVHIGHVQISQVPRRNEPNAEGEINYPYILKLLSTLGYDGYVGLEYFPTGETVKSLSWIKDYGYDSNNIAS